MVMQSVEQMIRALAGQVPFPELERLTPESYPDLFTPTGDGYYGENEGAPPELLDLLRGERRFQDYYEWVAMMEETDPYTLFLLQLTDYVGFKYWERYQENIEPKKLKKDFDDDKVEAAKDANAYAASIMQLGEMYLRTGMPLQEFPLYEEVRRRRGITVERRWKKDVLVQQKAIEKEEKELATLRRGIEELKTHAGTKAGRINLQQAVDAGLMTADEAFAENPYYQEYTQGVQREVAGKEAEEFERKAKEEERGLLERGDLLRNVFSPGGRQNLAQAVAEGQITPQEAFGPGTAWEKWQHEQAGEVMKGTYRGGDAAETLRRLIGQAKEAGIDTTQAESAFAQQAYGGGRDEPLAQMSQGLNEQIKAQAQSMKARQSQVLGWQYPEEFQRWKNEFLKGYGTVAAPTQGWESGFYNWAMAKPLPGEEPLTPEQTAFQQRRNEAELKMWQDYGDIYGEYQGFLAKAPEFKPIEKWIEETPEVKARYRPRRYPTSPMAVWR